MPDTNRRNTKFGQEMADQAFELIARGVVQPTKVAKAIGLHYKTLSGILLKSSRNDPKYLIQFHDEEMQFAKAWALSRKLAYLELRGMVEQQSIHGRDEIVHFNGNVVFAVDLAAAAIDDPDIREICGYRRDALLEVDKKLVPVTRHIDPPFAMQIRLLESQYRDLRPSSVSEVNINGNVAHGIQHLPRPDYSKGPPAIPPPPVRPTVPELVVLPDEPVKDADFHGSTHPPEVEPMASVEPEPEAPVEPEPMAPVRAETEAALTGRTLSPLEQDLLRRLRAPIEERSKPV
jgi:hypothetical protein